MNKLKSNKSGFTLLEIIVVMIIVGVLAAVAIPNLFGNINRGDGSGALQTLQALRLRTESCLATNRTVVPNAAPCTTALLLTPSNNNGWAFQYATGAVAAATATSGATSAPAGTAGGDNLVYSIVAIKNANTISLSRTAAGNWSCSDPTAGPYVDVCAN